VADSSVEKRLLIREVPVEGSDPDARPFSDGVPGGLAADFQNELDGDFDEPLSVFFRIGPHRPALAPSLTIE
jgi:hypothetical protein